MSMMTWLIASAAAASALASPIPAEPKPSRTRLQCEIAAVALPDGANRELTLFSADPVAATPAIVDNLDAGYLNSKWVGQTPRTSTLTRLKTVLGTSALSCANVKAAAASRGSVVSEQQGRQQLKQMGLNGTTAFVHRISLPAVDEETGEAVVAIVSSSNQLAGGIYLVFLRRDGRTWAVAGRRTVIAS